MEIQPLNKVVTSCFLVATVEQSKEGLSLKYKVEPNLLSAHLVRAAAHKIVIPANKTDGVFPDTARAQEILRKQTLSSSCSSEKRMHWIS